MYKYVKRLLDLIFCLIGFVFALIPMVIVAIAIKIDSRGPVKMVKTSIYINLEVWQKIMM